jgi:hypothetical protein
MKGKESDRDNDGEAGRELHKLNYKGEHWLCLWHIAQEYHKTKTTLSGGFCFARPIF